MPRTWLVIVPHQCRGDMPGESRFVFDHQNTHSRLLPILIMIWLKCSSPKSLVEDNDKSLEGFGRESEIRSNGFAFSARPVARQRLVASDARTKLDCLGMDRLKRYFGLGRRRGRRSECGWSGWR